MKFRSEAADQIKSLLEWQKTAQKEETGVNVSGLMKDILVAELDIDPREAERLSEIFDSKLTEQAFLKTHNGTTFTKVLDS
jgi:hypothetical protein